jgi:hypothetical protein
MGLMTGQPATVNSRTALIAVGVRIAADSPDTTLQYRPVPVHGTTTPRLVTSGASPKDIRPSGRTAAA